MDENMDADMNENANENLNQNLNQNIDFLRLSTKYCKISSVLYMQLSIGISFLCLLSLFEFVVSMAITNSINEQDDNWAKLAGAFVGIAAYLAIGIFIFFLVLCIITMVLCITGFVAAKHKRRKGLIINAVFKLVCASIPCIMFTIQCIMLLFDGQISGFIFLAIYLLFIIIFSYKQMYYAEKMID